MNETLIIGGMMYIYLSAVANWKYSLTNYTLISFSYFSFLILVYGRFISLLVDAVPIVDWSTYPVRFD